MRRGKSRQKLAIWSALYPYLGGKRRLCPLIFREIDRVVPRRLWEGLTFLDAFLGGGSVALYAKAQGFKIIATDIAERAIIVGRALIENSRVRLSREDILRLAAPIDDPPGRVEREYVPKVFRREQARFLDRAFAAAATTDPARAALYRLLAIRVALKAHPMSQVRAGTIHRFATGEIESITESCLYHYVDGLRLTRPGTLWDFAQQINAGVFEGEGRVLKADILEVLPTVQADIAYFDPPYPGTVAHEREYKVLDEILEGASLPISDFSAKDGVSMVDELLKRGSHIPVWVLSFGNAVTGIEDLVARMQKCGRQVRAIEVRYAHKVSVATEIKKMMNREFIVVGWDREAALIRRTSNRSARFVERDSHLAVPLHVHVGPGGPEGPSALGLESDGFEQGEPSKPEKAAPEGREPTEEMKPGVDEPDTVLGEASIDRNGERDIRLGGHGDLTVAD